MKKTKQEKNRLDPNASLGWGERIGYGVSNLGISILFVPLTSFLLIYLTNVAFLDIAAVSAIIGVSKVLDGISDLVIGNIIDRTRSRLGKGRVWLLRMCLPFAVSMMLLFFVPASLPSAVKYIYVFILYNLVSTVFFTFMSISSYSLIPLMTMNREEQGVLSCAQAIFTSVGAMIAATCFVPMLSMFSGSAGTPQTQRGYSVTIAILCGIMVVSTLITVASTRERGTGSVSDGDNEPAAKMPLRSVVRALLSNKYWVFIFFIALGHNLFGQFSISSLTYFATYVMHDLEAVTWLNLAQMLSSLLVQIIVLLLMKKIGKTQLTRFGLLLLAVGNFGIGLSRSSQAGMIVCNILKGLGMGIFLAVFLGLVADTILYTYRRSGIFTAGMGNAGITASQKIGTGLAVALFGVLMKVAGFDALYDVQQLPQPASVEHAATWGFAWIPGIGYAILFVLFVCFYHLDREMSKTAGEPEET